MKNFQYVKEFFGFIRPEESVDKKSYLVLEKNEIFQCKIKESVKIYIKEDEKYPTVLILKENMGECFIYSGVKENIVWHLYLKKGVAIIWPERGQVIIQDDFKIIEKEKIRVKVNQHKKYSVNVNGKYKKCRIIKKKVFVADINDKTPLVVFGGEKSKYICNVIKNEKQGIAIFKTLELPSNCIILPKDRTIIVKRRLK